MYKFTLLLLAAILSGCLRPASEAEKSKLPEPEQVLVEYTHLTPTDFRARLAEAPIAYLPMGTLEWHGEHLPLGSDGLQSFSFMKDLARKVGGIVLPMLYLGPDMMRIKDDMELYGMDVWLSEEKGKMQMPAQQLDGSSYWVPEELFHQIMDHSIKQLARAGFKIIVAHGHGPSTNHVIKHWQEWEQKYGVLVYTCWSWNVRGENDVEASERAGQEGLGIMIDHAASNESSLMLYYYPELVHMEQLSDDSAQWPLAVAGKDPRIYASAEQGQRAVEYQLERMEQVLQQALDSVIAKNSEN